MADAEAVAALVRRAYAKWVPIIGREPKPMSADHRDAIARHAVFVVDDPGGCLAAAIELEPDGDHLLIVSVAVDPDCQGRGIGRRLMAFAEAETLRRNLPAFASTPTNAWWGISPSTGASAIAKPNGGRRPGRIR